MTVSRLLVCWMFVNQWLVIIDGFCAKNNNDEHCCYGCSCDQQQTINNHVFVCISSCLFDCSCRCVCFAVIVLIAK